jgi:hypothetical protein
MPWLEIALLFVLFYQELRDGFLRIYTPARGASLPDSLNVCPWFPCAGRV